MPRSVAEIQAELDAVNAAITTILGGGVSSFAHEGGDSASMLRLADLREHRTALNQEMAAVVSGARPRFSPMTRY